MLKSNLGFSLIEALIAAAIGGIIVFGLASSLQIGNQMVQRSNQYSDQYSLESELRLSLNNENICTSNINLTRLASVQINTASLSNPISVNSIIDSSGRVIVQRGQFGKIEVTDIALTDFKEVDINKTYLGQFTLSSKLGAINKVSKIPVFFETSGTGPTLTLIRCGGSYDTQISVINEQVCSALNGTFNQTTQKCSGIVTTQCPTSGDVVRGISSTGQLDCFTPPPPTTINNCPVGNVVSNITQTSITCTAPAPTVTITNCPVGYVVTSSSNTNVTCGPDPTPITVTNCPVGYVVSTSTNTSLTCVPDPSPSNPGSWWRIMVSGGECGSARPACPFDAATSTNIDLGYAHPTCPYIGLECQVAKGKGMYCYRCQ